MGGRHWEGMGGTRGRRSDEGKEKGEMGFDDSPIGETDDDGNVREKKGVTRDINN